MLHYGLVILLLGMFIAGEPSIFTYVNIPIFLCVLLLDNLISIRRIDSFRVLALTNFESDYMFWK